MQPEYLHIELLSDAAFGRGEATAGVVDIEVEHDELGLPFLGGKTLRGLLRDSWLSMQSHFPDLWSAAKQVFGKEADLEGNSILHIANAVVDSNVHKWIQAAIQRNKGVSPHIVLEALTDIRRQTSEERTTGIPAETTLRSIRVVTRGLTLQAHLHWIRTPERKALQCLALAALATRHAGLGRNRGRGHIRITFDGDLERTRKLAKGE